MRAVHPTQTLEHIPFAFLCWRKPGWASLQVIPQNEHIAEDNAMLCYRWLNIGKIVTSDCKHAKATFLVESNVLQGSIGRPNQQRLPSTPAQLLLEKVYKLLSIAASA
jgi:hypothetical protein